MGYVVRGPLRRGALLWTLVVVFALLGPPALAQDPSATESASESESPSESPSGSESPTAAASELEALTAEGVCVQGERAVWKVTNPNATAVEVSFDDGEPLAISAEPGETVFEAAAVDPLTITYDDPVQTATATLATAVCEYDITLTQVWQDSAGQTVGPPAQRGEASLTAGSEAIEPGTTGTIEGTATSYTVAADAPAGWDLVDPASGATREGVGEFPLTLTDAAAALTHELVYKRVAVESASTTDEDDIVVPSRVDTGGGGTAPGFDPLAVIAAFIATLVGGGAWLIRKRTRHS